MVEPDDIVTAVLPLLSPRPAPRTDLAGRRVAVSTGGTREPIDPVRFLGNRSSGRQGTELALAAAERGADVTLVAAHVDDGVLTTVARHPRIALVRAGTTDELQRAMTRAAATADVVAMVAAVADFRPTRLSHDKLRKEDGVDALALTPTADVLAALVAARRPGQTIIGFAAETAGDDDELLERGRRKRDRKGVDYLAVNRVDWDLGFEASENRVVLLDASGAVVVDTAGTKRAVADALWTAIAPARHA